MTEPLKPLTRIQGRGIPLRGDDIDTDRIIPARFLKCVTFQELGHHAFQDERYDAQGDPREHPLNDPRFRGGVILLVNRNFGCGSSREHAPQSLMRHGIRAFVGESFAEIFAGNCTALGLPAIRASRRTMDRLMSLVEKEPDTELIVDLEAKTIRVKDLTFQVEMPESDRSSLLAGTWDTTAALLAGREEILTVAGRLPYLNHFNG